VRVSTVIVYSTALSQKLHYSTAAIVTGWESTSVWKDCLKVSIITLYYITDFWSGLSKNCKDHDSKNHVQQNTGVRLSINRNVLIMSD